MRIINLTAKLIFLLCILNTLPGNSQGKVIEQNSLESKILGTSVKFSIYLPADYFNSDRLYPVLYLLHGHTDNETAWVQYGEVNLTADKLIANRDIPPMIIVMPDAGESWYINNYNGKVKYEEFFFSEFIPYIEKTYRIRNKKEFRAIGGLSMGGYGSLLYAMKHPDMFSVCLPFSAGVHTDTEMKEKYLKNDAGTFAIYGSLKGDTLSDVYRKNSILDLAKTLPKEQLSSVKYYIDCGDKDYLIEGNCDLHLDLKERGIPHEFRVREGEHNWSYWRVSIIDGLKFLGQSIRR